MPGLSPSSNQPQNEKQQTRADDCRDDRADKWIPKCKAEAREQYSGNERSDDADDDIADETKSAALHDLPGQPAGNGADNQPNDQLLEIDFHFVFSVSASTHTNRSTTIICGKTAVDKIANFILGRQLTRGARESRYF